MKESSSKVHLKAAFIVLLVFSALLVLYKASYSDKYAKYFEKIRSKLYEEGDKNIVWNAPSRIDRLSAYEDNSVINTDSKADYSPSPSNSISVTSVAKSDLTRTESKSSESDGLTTRDEDESISTSRPTSNPSLITSVSVTSATQSDHKKMESRSSETKTILFWYIPFNDKRMTIHYFTSDRDKLNVTLDWMNVGYSVDTPQCGNCRIIYNQREISRSDAVVFHGRDISQRSLPSPSSRTPRQLYVWWLEESTVNSGQSGRYLVDYFNATMFVRRSSDVFSPYLSFPTLLHLIGKKQDGVDLLRYYAYLRKQEILTESQIQSAISSLPKNSMAAIPDSYPKDVSEEVLKLLKKKTRLAGWIVSNCGTTGAKMRYDFFKKVKGAGLNADVFGGCGTYRFPIRDRSDPAFNDVLSVYKFYLAWENSYHCEDYVTEKLWFNSLYSGAVPIIFGPHRDDIAAVLPPKSYIHVEDFSKPKDLVDYINYLDKNITAYAEYLEWRNLGRFFKEKDSIDVNSNDVVDEASKKELEMLTKYTQNGPSGFCALCKMLQNNQTTSKTVHSVDEMLKSDRAECLDNRKARNMMGL